MKKMFLSLFLFFSLGLYAQQDSLVTIGTNTQSAEIKDENTPVLTWNDKREPFLAGFLSYLVPGAGQVYNKQYEKAFGVVAVMGFSFIAGVQGSETGNETLNVMAACGMAGAWLYSFIDATVSAKKINSAIAFKMRNLSIRPDVQLNRSAPISGLSKPEPTLGLRMNVSF